MALAGEIISAAGGIAAMFPYAHHLTHDGAQPLNPWVWKLWSIGILLVDVYFQDHPKAGHHKHKHVITDIIHIPVTLRIVLPIIALLAWLCLLKDRYKSGQFPSGSRKDQVKTVATWVVVPLGVTAVIFSGASLARGLFTYPSEYLMLMAFIGLLGAVAYTAGCIAMIRFNGPQVDVLMLFVQILGFFLIICDIIFVYKVVDWPGMVMIAIQAIANAFIALFGIFPSRFKDNSNLYEMVSQPKHTDDELEP